MAFTTVILDPGAGGAGVSVDTVGGGNTQVVKLDGGAAGATVPILSGGGVEASAIRVTLANDSTGVITANLGATDNAVLDTIDAVLDTINAKLVTGTIIGDVNLGATDNAVLDAIAASVAGTVTVGGTVTANLSATDNAVLDTIDAVLDLINAKLVTGTVIGDVNLGATDNAVLNAIVTNTTGLNGTVSGSELQVDIVASLPAGTNAIGKLAANSGVDIGDVDILSIIPGTGATNLGKAVDSVAGSTDTGLAMLAVHLGDTSHLTSASGDYDVLRMSDYGALQVEPEQHHILDEMDATTGWTVLGNDTTNLAATTTHVLGTNALTFDKADGAANTVIAGIQKTLSSENLGGISPHDILQTVVYASSTADADYIFLRLGDDSSNYNEWRIAAADITSGAWSTLVFEVGDASQAGGTGTGVNWTDVDYIAVGIAFNSESDTLTGIIFDEISFHTNQHVNASLNSEVTSSVNSANINVQKVGGSATDKNSGNASNGCQRVVIATDDVNLAAIKTAIEILDNAIAGTEMQVDVVAALPAGTAVIGQVGLEPRTSGGNSFFKTIDLDESEEEVKATAGQLYSVFFTNSNAAVRYLKIYNATAASVTVGTTVPDLTFAIPPDNGGLHLSWPHGLQFGTAITLAATTGVADADSGAHGANEIIGMAEYK